jgi:hypothetical protein
VLSCYYARVMQPFRVKFNMKRQAMQAMNFCDPYLKSLLLLMEVFCLTKVTERAIRRELYLFLNTQANEHCSGPG